MRGWQANIQRTCAQPVVLGLCPKTMKYPPLCGGYLLFRFLFRNLRFHSFDHLGEFDFTSLFRFGVDIEFLSLTIWQSWEEAAFPEVVVDLIQVSGAGFAYLPRHRLGMGLCGRTRGVYGRFCTLLGCLLYHGHLRVCAEPFRHPQVVCMPFCCLLSLSAQQHTTTLFEYPATLVNIGRILFLPCNPYHNPQHFP